MKKCIKCHETKDLIYFHLSKTAKSGRHSYCKTCRNQDITTKNQSKKVYDPSRSYEPCGNTTKKCIKCEEIKDLTDFNPHKRAKYGRYPCCKICQKQKEMIYCQQNKEKIRIYRKNNREKLQHQARERYQKNKKKIIAYQKIYAQKKRDNNPTYRLIGRLRANLYGIMKEIKKNTKKEKATKEFLGCGMEAFKIHLESQFSAGMSWDNHGKWHLDHIKPCCSFDLADIEQQKVCFHYTNLQPLWAIDNIKKAAKYL